MRIRPLIILSFLGLMAQSAWACPELAGNYTCVDQHGQFEMTVSEQSSSGSMLYNFDSHGNGSDLAVITDGVSHPISESGIRDGKYTASCAGDHMIADATGTLLDGGQAAGDLTIRYDVYRDSAQGLVTKTTGAISSSQGNYPINGTVTCIHQ